MPFDSGAGAFLVPGPSGASAYEAWRGLGNTGTVADFLKTLVGPKGGDSNVPGPEGKAGPAGAGSIAIRTASVAVPPWTAVIADGPTNCLPADPLNISHRGRVIGVTALGAAIGGAVTIQNAGDLIGSSAGFAAQSSLLVGAGGRLSSSSPNGATWRQLVATVVSDGQVVVSLGEASVIGDDADAMIDEGGFALPASRDQALAAATSGYLVPDVAHDLIATRQGLTRNSIQTAYFPLVQTIIVTCGYANPGDGGGAAYREGAADGAGAVQDARGRWWVLATPERAPAEAWGVNAPGLTDNGPLFRRILNLCGTLNLGASIYVVRSTIRTGSRPVIINGAGMYQTVIVTDVAGGMFEHGVTIPVPASGAAFTVRDCRLARAGGTRDTTTGKIPGVAVWVKQVAGPGEVVMTNVLIDGYSNDSAWEKCVLVDGPAQLLKFTNLRISAGAFETTTAALDRGTDIGVHLRSADNDHLIYQVRFQDCVLEGVYTGLLLELNGPVGNTGSIEGVSLIDCGGRSVRGPWIKQKITIRQSDGSVQAWYPPGFWMERCNFQGAYAMLEADSLGEVHIKKNFHYIEGAVDRAHSFVPHMVYIGYAAHAHITGNSFYTFTQRPFFGNPGNFPVKLQSLICIPAGNWVHVSGNRLSVEFSGNEDVGYGILFGASNVLKGLDCRDNFFDGGGSGASTPWPWGDARRVFNGQASFYAEGFSDPALTLVHNPQANATAAFLRVNRGGALGAATLEIGPADSAGTGYRTVRIAN